MNSNELLVVYDYDTTTLADIRRLPRAVGNVGIAVVFAEGLLPYVWLTRDSEDRRDFTARTQVLPAKSTLSEIASAMTQQVKATTGLKRVALHEGITFYDHSRYGEKPHVATLFTATTSRMPHTSNLERYDLRKINHDYWSQEFRGSGFSGSFLTIMDLAIQCHNTQRAKMHERTVNEYLTQSPG